MTKKEELRFIYPGVFSSTSSWTHVLQEHLENVIMVEYWNPGLLSNAGHGTAFKKEEVWCEGRKGQRGRCCICFPLRDESLHLSIAVDFKCQRRSIQNKKVLQQNLHGHLEQRMETRRRKGVLDSRPIFPTFFYERDFSVYKVENSVEEYLISALFSLEPLYIFLIWPYFCFRCNQGETCNMNHISGRRHF